jgi:hypothetical protein
MAEAIGDRLKVPYNHWTRLTSFPSSNARTYDSDAFIMCLRTADTVFLKAFPGDEVDRFAIAPLEGVSR